MSFAVFLNLMGAGILTLVVPPLTVSYLALIVIEPRTSSTLDCAAMPNFLPSIATVFLETLTSQSQDVKNVKIVCFFAGPQLSSAPSHTETITPEY
jgi:hypothetical protein